MCHSLHHVGLECQSIKIKNDDIVITRSLIWKRNEEEPIILLIHFKVSNLVVVLVRTELFHLKVIFNLQLNDPLLGLNA